MTNNAFKEEQVFKRAFVIASQKSHFIGGVSNRVLLPLGLSSILGTFYISVWMIPIFIGYFLFEIVLHYGLKMSLRDLLRTIWRAFFGTSRPVARN